MCVSHSVRSCCTITVNESVNGWTLNTNSRLEKNCWLEVRCYRGHKEIDYIESRKCWRRHKQISLFYRRACLLRFGRLLISHTNHVIFEMYLMGFCIMVLGCKIQTFCFNFIMETNVGASHQKSEKFSRHATWFFFYFIPNIEW